ncbi:hypothetical protein ACFX5E_15480 [Flavobacterium sp. LS2P90]|uniref:Uncharacterized protein n=1 Tax=Flavobacterium xylosi TaxID=3230415 RepID=A0ABW6I0X1_9FLAO
MKKSFLMGLILLFTFSSSPSRKEKKQQIIYYNTSNYKYDDEIINRTSRR